MRLSWNEVLPRVESFSGKWWFTVYEKGETQSFYSGIVKLTLRERTYRVELTSFALIGRHRLPPARR